MSDSIHDSSMGSAPVGVQCPLTSSLVEFQDYSDWLWYPGLPPVLVSSAFSPLPSIFRCFPFTLLHLPFIFICVSSLQLMYLQFCTHQSTLHLLTFRRVSRLRTGSGI